ncbi:hypothetical protein [Helicobacter sp. MIT 11-5569]|uniref:hypothetical protein n=1 Tax=Helicobacter sp. MIT 11-5569 TaxID=1548151 RepID=UPI000A5870BF|nr:hypothetical protein [Helicobacter sp. MIT 11-5569]
MQKIFLCLWICAMLFAQATIAKETKQQKNPMEVLAQKAKNGTLDETEIQY